MKPEELMIGDWYYWEAEGKKYPLQVTKETFALADEDIANFQPIPITPEILEKNGFFYNEQQGVYHRIPADGYAIEQDEEDKEMFYFELYVYNPWNDYGWHCFAPMRYVHQLQHLVKSIDILEIKKGIIV